MVLTITTNKTKNYQKCATKTAVLLFVHAEGRCALSVSQFTQFRTPISHPFFAYYPFEVSRFAFRRLLIAIVSCGARGVRRAVFRNTAGRTIFFQWTFSGCHEIWDQEASMIPQFSFHSAIYHTASARNTMTNIKTQGQTQLRIGVTRHDFAKYNFHSFPCQTTKTSFKSETSDNTARHKQTFPRT